MESSIQQPTQDAPILNIVGEKVALGPIHRGWIPLIHKWQNDFQVALFSGDPLRPVSLEAIQAEYEEHTKKQQRYREETFGIYARTTLQPLGVVELRHINLHGRTATMGIGIGEKDYWSKGYGTEAILLILDYGFTVLGLHNIDLTTYAYNDRATGAYLKAGFKLIGRRREAHRWGGKIYDELHMDCLATEFQLPGHLKSAIELP
ncbi:GNAT family N-acetyltransferase [Tengunoibacter tsumagoiensis]|uniref:N-acetyltransferase n=1 Tax=Tengunoibacter tsumagoiensis TaxID=2014871 RepID=A0A401ZXX1_9CHLR|nr:GNAT family protein [Tengunoibacter tsumagoiensis]GCE11689.1 N-acetyltransferase [Tengunoibacter tsumagoiensis]